VSIASARRRSRRLVHDVPLGSQVTITGRAIRSRTRREHRRILRRPHGVAGAASVRAQSRIVRGRR
jgi:hypothetical protein